MPIASLPGVLLFLTILSSQAVSQSGIPISLPDLARVSTRIFVAKVARVELVPGSVRPEASDDRPIKKIEFDVMEVVKGEKIADNKLTIRQYDKVSSPVQEGDKVLWFLGRANSSGFMTPLGLLSGDFRVFTAQGYPKELVVSRNKNTLLWSKEKSFWDSSSHCLRTVFVRELEKRKVGRDEIDQFLLLADNPHKDERPLPLDFVIAAAMSCLN